VGPYQLQAAVAAVHDESPRHEDTDWPQIAALYVLLERMSGNPMVTLSRAIAVAMVEGAHAGLEMLDGLATGRPALPRRGQPDHQYRRAHVSAHASGQRARTYVAAGLPPLRGFGGQIRPARPCRSSSLPFDV
jgi:predicted RNA polymerase sigma factor